VQQLHAGAHRDEVGRDIERIRDDQDRDEKTNGDAPRFEKRM